VNTSWRRAPVIAWAITAGLLYGAVGIGTAASAGADARSPGTDDTSNDSGPRRHGRDGTRPDNGSGAWQPGDPGPWPAPIAGGDSGNNGLIFVPDVAATIPVPVFGDRVESPVATDALPEDMVSVVAPVAAPPVPAAPTVPVAHPSSGPRAVRVPAAPAPRPSAPRAIPVAPAPASPPAAPLPPQQPPALGAAPPVPVRLGYPDDLRDADLAKVVSMALPGLAAMAGMTALGGLVGYRQARAGYELRVAGAGRFLQ